MNISPKAGAAKDFDASKEGFYDEVFAYIMDNFNWWAKLSIDEREKFLQEWFREAE